MFTRVVCLLLIAALTATVTCPAAQPLEAVRVGIPGKLVDFAPFFVGIKTGIYRSEGLEPQFIVMRSGIIFPALLSGELDYTTLYQSAIRSAISGLPVRVIATLMTKQTFFLFSQREIRRVQDLKGKRIAISNFASSTDSSARAALKHHGLEAMRDATLIAMGDTGVRFQALLSGAIEAAILTPPYTVMAEKKGLNNLVWLGDILGDVPSNGLSTTLKTLKENSDQVHLNAARLGAQHDLYPRAQTGRAADITERISRPGRRYTCGHFGFLREGDEPRWTCGRRCRSRIDQRTTRIAECEE